MNLIEHTLYIAPAQRGNTACLRIHIFLQVSFCNCLCSVSTAAVFNAGDLKKLSGGDGTYTLALIDSLKIGKNEFSPSFRKRNAAVFQIASGSLCEAAIEPIPKSALRLYSLTDIAKRLARTVWT